jgi:hypothetical protein
VKREEKMKNKKAVIDDEKEAIIIYRKLRAKFDLHSSFFRLSIYV